MFLNSHQYMELPIDDIKLDLRNPRIAKWIEYYGEDVPAEQIALALGAGSSDSDDNSTTFTSLRESIRTNGGVIHPIIVNKLSSDQHIVIEGNTRVAIYREFKEDEVQGNWQYIPAMVYDNLEEKQIDSIRLQAHLVGPRPWDPYSKAKYLDHLRRKEHLTIDQIVDFCGGKKPEVIRYISAYKDMEKYYRSLLASDSEFDASRFSAFVELQHQRVTSALLSSGYSKKDFSLWVHERKLSPLNTVRQLPRILMNKDSKEIFFKEGAQAAIKLLNTLTSVIESSLSDFSIEQIVSELYKKCSEMPYDKIRQYKNTPNPEKEIFFDLNDIVSDFCDLITTNED